LAENLKPGRAVFVCLQGAPTGASSNDGTVGATPKAGENRARTQVCMSDFRCPHPAKGGTEPLEHHLKHHRDWRRPVAQGAYQSSATITHIAPSNRKNTDIKKNKMLSPGAAAPSVRISTLCNDLPEIDRVVDAGISIRHHFPDTARPMSLCCGHGHGFTDRRQYEESAA
jgi:hypothetical protein